MIFVLFLHDKFSQEPLNNRERLKERKAYDVKICV